jgi:hypothetical protein
VVFSVVNFINLRIVFVVPVIPPLGKSDHCGLDGITPALKIAISLF